MESQEENKDLCLMCFKIREVYMCDEKNDGLRINDLFFQIFKIKMETIHLKHCFCPRCINQMYIISELIKNTVENIELANSATNYRNVEYKNSYIFESTVESKVLKYKVPFELNESLPPESDNLLVPRAFQLDTGETDEDYEDMYCHQCDRHFGSRRHWRSHALRHSRENQARINSKKPRKYRCPDCEDETVFNTLVELNAHKQNHRQRFVCRFCMLEYCSYNECKWHEVACTKINNSESSDITSCISHRTRSRSRLSHITSMKSDLSETASIASSRWTASSVRSGRRSRSQTPAPSQTSARSIAKSTTTNRVSNARKTRIRDVVEHTDDDDGSPMRMRSGRRKYTNGEKPDVVKKRASQILIVRSYVKDQNSFKNNLTNSGTAESDQFKPAEKDRFDPEEIQSDQEDYLLAGAESVYVGDIVRRMGSYKLWELNKRFTTRERIYRCQVKRCGFETNSVDTLSMHEMQKHNRKPWYNCQECYRCYTDQELLNYHKMDNHHVGPQMCLTCNHMFPTVKDMQKHMYHTHYNRPVSEKVQKNSFTSTPPATTQRTKPVSKTKSAKSKRGRKPKHPKQTLVSDSNATATISNNNTQTNSYSISSINCTNSPHVKTVGGESNRKIQSSSTPILNGFVPNISSDLSRVSPNATESKNSTLVSNSSEDTGSASVVRRTGTETSRSSPILFSKSKRKKRRKSDAYSVNSVSPVNFVNNSAFNNANHSNFNIVNILSLSDERYNSEMNHFESEHAPASAIPEEQRLVNGYAAHNRNVYAITSSIDVNGCENRTTSLDSNCNIGNTGSAVLKHYLNS